MGNRLAAEAIRVAGVTKVSTAEVPHLRPTISRPVFGWGGNYIRSMTVDDPSKTVTTSYLLDGQSVIREYVQSLDKPDHSTISSTVTCFNGLGSVIGEVDQQGNITSTNKLDVYGLARVGGTGASESNHKFVGSLGHTSESSTDLIYMRAR